MTARASVLALVLALAGARTAAGQLRVPSIAIFGGVGAIGGVGQLRTPTGDRFGAAGGLRLDGGVQGERLAGGVLVRYTELARTGSYGGRGVDAALLGEWRASSDARTSVRAAVGLGYADFESSDRSITPSDNVGTLLSLGVARELASAWDSSLIVSADVVVPPASGGYGRRAPVIELGFGYRWRSVQPVGLPGPMR